MRSEPRAGHRRDVAECAGASVTQGGSNKNSLRSGGSGVDEGEDAPHFVVLFATGPPISTGTWGCPNPS